jgi:predicted transcriptional regulator
MEQVNQTEELLKFFKALADENRLKIVGILANQSHTVEEIADMLTISVSTVSHHLARLSKAGLVSARAEGHYYRYSLQTEVLHQMSQRLLNTDALPKVNSENQPQTFDEKVLAAFMDENGRFRALPVQEKKFAVLIRHVIKAFEPDVRYTEKQVNEILSRFSNDTAALRRGMVEYNLMGRERDGSQYWRIQDCQ